MIPNWDEGAWDSGSWDSASAPPTPFPPIKKRKTKYKTMASNPTPDDDKVLVALAEDMADGCHDHEATIGILHNTEAVMRAAITAATDSIVALGSANVNLDAKYDVLQTADAGGEAVLKNCRLRMVKLYGGQYNSNWQAAGWKGRPRGDDSAGRACQMASVELAFDDALPWLQAPILNQYTRLVAIADAKQGRLMAQGYEADGAATAVLHYSA